MTESDVWKFCLAVKASIDKCQQQLGVIDGSIFITDAFCFRMAAWKLWDILWKWRKKVEENNCHAWNKFSRLLLIGLIDDLKVAN